jgi:Na+/proline symporter
MYVPLTNLRMLFIVHNCAVCVLVNVVNKLCSVCVFMCSWQFLISMRLCTCTDILQCVFILCVCPSCACAVCEFALCVGMCSWILAKRHLNLASYCPLF